MTPPDYTKQLDQIVKALNRPSLPTWIVAVLSVALGFVGSILVQLFQRYLAESRAKDRMRRVIYPDLAEMYWSAGIQLDQTGVEDASRRSRLATSLRFQGEKYADDDRATFLTLREYAWLESCWGALHSALIDDDYGFDLNCGLALEIIEDGVRLGEIPAKYVRKYVGETEAAKDLLRLRRTGHVHSKRSGQILHN